MATLDDAFKAMDDLTICVVGDVMLDDYIVGDVDRVSQEAPVPVVRVRDAYSRLGGAANVALNLSAMGCQVLLVGVVGDDLQAQLVYSLLDQSEMTGLYLAVENNRKTTQKRRVLAHGQQIVRIDHEDTGPLGEGADACLVESIRKLGHIVDAFVVSDYGKGVVNTPQLDTIRQSSKAFGLPIIIDPMARNLPHYVGATALTPNTKELLAMGHMIKYWDSWNRLEQEPLLDDNELEDRESDCSDSRTPSTFW
tara:strand:- start:7 stop:762 length:756 start_codon:yes stop_codon:yes gene_type:complete